MKSKYYNDAIIGNENMIATYSSRGELLRLLYPNRDFRQFIDFFKTGVKVNDSSLINLQDDINNTYTQYYTQDTNILNTVIENKYFNLLVEQQDFIPVEKNILIKKYKFTNNNTVILDTKFIIHSGLLTNYNNKTSSRISNNALIQYTHDYNMCIFAKKDIMSYQLNDTSNNIQSGVIGGKDNIGMSADSSISYNLGFIRPGESKEIDIIIYIHDNTKNYSLETIDNNIDKLRRIQISRELSDTKFYWEEFVRKHIDESIISKIDKLGKEDLVNKVTNIYIRTILLYPLLINYKTGGIAASIEVDENQEQSGRYNYCWPRDAAFIVGALDKLKMEKESEKFYKEFCKKTQSKNGMWEQRFYTDGHLAPCWGYQIDETASVVYGIYEHYKNTKDIKFLNDTLKMCENAVKYLKKYVQNICEDKKIVESYDLWEMHEGVHTYSLSAIYAAFNSMIKIYQEVKDIYQNNRLKQEAITKDIHDIKEYIYKINNYVSNNLVDEQKNLIYRSNKDQISDISVIGSVVPFGMFTLRDKKVKNTVEKMEMTLRTYTGGFLRFEGDHYRGGKSPWPITTLWMSMYYKQIGEEKKAREGFEFVVNSATKHGFLAEQVNNEQMKSDWVIGLGWSHAMFIQYLAN